MSEDDDQWRYSVDDFPDDEGATTDPERAAVESDGEEGDTDDTDEEAGGNVAGHIGGLDETLEPGTPTVENAFFVVLGAVATVLFFLVVVGVI